MSLADCKVDYEKAMSIADRAIKNQKKGQFEQAERYYKSAARKLRAMKYRCSQLNLDELRKNARKFQLLARQSNCGRQLQDAELLLQKIKAAQSQKKKSAKYQAQAKKIYNDVIKQCEGSTYVGLAQKQLEWIASLAQKKVVKKPARQVNTRRKSVNRCIKKHLAHVVTMEKDGDRAFRQKQYELAIKYYSAAAKLYVDESQQCSRSKDKIFALDKSKVLSARVDTIKSEHINCDGKVEKANLSIKRARQDEKLGDFDLARYGFMKAHEAFVALPDVCTPSRYTDAADKSLNRAKLLGCEHYVTGIKAYRSAAKAMGQAQHSVAGKHYGSAEKAFDSALKTCNFTAENQKLVEQMKATSAANFKRLAY